MIDICELVKDFSDNNDLYDDLYFYFERKINYLINSFNLEDYKSDVMYKLYKIGKSKGLALLNEAAMIENYVFKSLKNHCINLYRKVSREKVIQYNSELVDTILISKYENLNNGQSFDEIVSVLNKKRQQILKFKFKDGLSHEEIALKMSMSRMGVYKNVKKSLEILRCEGGEKML